MTGNDAFSGHYNIIVPKHISGYNPAPNLDKAKQEEILASHIFHILNIRAQ